LSRALAEMQSVDLFKLDNDYIFDTVKELRFNVKNWVHNQQLNLSLEEGLNSEFNRTLLYSDAWTKIGIQSCVIVLVVR
jgi:hypothetical protein